MTSDIPYQADLAQEGAYSFLPVWRKLSLLLIILTIALLVIVLVGEFLQPRFDLQIERVLSLALVPLSVLLWLVVSVLPESRVARPRRRLIGVAVVSALTASAIGMPLVRDFFRVAEWLPLQSVFLRIVGYALTAGIVNAGLKFVVLRYLIYPQGLRVRSDAIAYALASAVGYSAFLSFALIWQLEPTWDIAAIYLLANLTIQLASSMFIALGIVESYFSDAYPLVLPINVAVAALTTGVITALVGGFLSGPLTTAGNAARPLFAFAMLVAALVITLGTVYFLYSNSERREREAYMSQWNSEWNLKPGDRRQSRLRLGNVGPIAITYCVIVFGFALGVNQRDSTLNQASIYSNLEAGITAIYPARWLLEESGTYVFRVRDMSHRGFNTAIEVSTAPVGTDTTERNILDQLSLQRSQVLIDYTVLGYDTYRLPDERQAISMSYSFVSRDTSPFLEGVSSIVNGLDILTIRRGQALIISFRADASIYSRELDTLRWFVQNLEF